ncbi:MAG: hypothetical protein AAF387_15995 [Pseudomonadota bacterium]
MAEIKIHRFPNKDLTVFAVIGALRLAELKTAVDEFYSGKFTLNTMWDLREADISAIEVGEVKEILDYSMEYLKRREGGRSAILVSTDVNYGMGRVFDTFVELSSSPVENNVFRDYEEAMAWFEPPMTGN